MLYVRLISDITLSILNKPVALKAGDMVRVDVKRLIAYHEQSGYHFDIIKSEFAYCLN